MTNICSHIDYNIISLEQTSYEVQLPKFWPVCVNERGRDNAIGMCNKQRSVWQPDCFWSPLGSFL